MKVSWSDVPDDDVASTVFNEQHRISPNKSLENLKEPKDEYEPLHQEGAKYGFFFDQTLCTGCKACQIACTDKHDLPTGVRWRRVVEYAGGGWQTSGDTFSPSVFTYYTSISCNHCEDPIYMEVCPTTAISRRDDGTVYVDQDKCVGCRYCEWACPYSAPQ